ncbi:hypothetical protein ACFE04_028602 [Oxalis oulophora]
MEVVGSTACVAPPNGGAGGQLNEIEVVELEACVAPPNGGAGGQLNEIEVVELEAQDKKDLIDSQADNFLSSLRRRIDRVGIEIPTIEVRFENLRVEAEEYHVGSRALPSFTNFSIDMFELISIEGHESNVITEYVLKFHPATNSTLGVAVMKSRSFYPYAYWYWIGIGALVGFIILFNALFTLFLTVLNAHDKKRAVILESESKEIDSISVGAVELSSSQVIGAFYCGSVQSIVSLERTVSYRERAAGMYSALPYAIGQVKRV